MKSSRSAWLLSAFFAGITFASCAGPSLGLKNQLHSLIREEKYDQAEQTIEQAKEKEYGKKNAVLFHLDMAMVLHDMGRYKESDSHFDDAERRMQELWTVSITKTAGTFFINDNTTEYEGEPFERALTNVFRALNYTYLGDRDNALVEVRKSILYLTELREKYEMATRYKDDALAEYLGSLLFEDDGRYDDARISRAAASRAYKDYAASYGTPEPKFELGPDWKTKGEVVFFHYNGIAPVKLSKTFQVAWNDAVIAVNASKEDKADDPRVQNAIIGGALGNQITVAYPVYADQPFAIAASVISTNTVEASTVLMEDISAIAKDALEHHNAAIRTRMIARATIKFIISKAISDEAEKQGGSTLGFLAQMATGAVSAATEIADTRCWGTLPAQVRMSRMLLPPGKYDLAVSFKDKNGTVVSTRIIKDVEAQKGRRVYLHTRTAS